ncbi:hydrogenase nickel incorporation protein HypB [Sulfurospirillum diekertiae]|uniref:Hydrogenase nickel incorporation protein HypB n=1 Tax=Sulfurospirillum diekertiae TaxID=1854492 RepID=A0A6G9VUT3_9BACT|nr:hydrogenase nickel incorporation protein HypB [Sulfurospirillum diekertiae]QIR77154.1 hydrogenase nickel incorporation protein HypB [Sulfurospirillum diekertiae]QIR79769.1 hydrogenase nickel incorporation protein HypB [Sulfurospirillum diekertiae]
MCKDCGCSITPTQWSAAHAHEHDHDGHTHSHSHDHDHHEHKNHDEIHANPQLNDKKTIAVITKILDANDTQASHNRAHFEEHGVLAINLMSSPGSGKTTLLEATIDTKEIKLAVIEGDLETNQDADRITAKGALAHQITTGQACHLDAFMVHEGLHHLPIDGLDVVFIENVGNLVCPASYDVGSHLNVVLLSVPEGDDKPAKYPVMFRSADLFLITKCDLLPYFDFNVEKAIREARKLNPKVDVIEIDSKSGKGIDQWINYLKMKKALR